MAEEDGKGGKMPRLTIMEEVLLLGLKDKQVSPTRFFLLHSLHFMEPDFRHGVTAVRNRNSFHAHCGFPSDCYGGQSDEFLVLLRDTSHSGMTTYHMPCVGAFS